jgi:hypothetical protein
MNHLRQRPPCDVGDPMFTDRITDEQLTQLKQKQHGRSAAENWYSVFVILFPSAPRPESPCERDVDLQLRCIIS